MSNSRTVNTFKNTFAALAEQIIYNVMSFVCRTVFIYTLGKTYLGFSGLFSDILALMSLAELGVGTAILYSMYKPAAEGDFRQEAALLNLYRRIYHIMGIVISAIGICLTPFLDFFISDIPDMPEIPLIYLLYLANTSASYFFIYKRSILIVHQQSRVASLIYTVSMIIQNILHIIFLFATHNFILYLIIQVCCTLANNICVSVYVDKHYKYLKDYSKEKVSPEVKKDIFKNVRAMFFSKVSSAIVTSTDNILISKFVSTLLLGLYSNYTLFTNMLRMVITKVFEGITGSVGNLVATKKPDEVYAVFRKIWFANYWIVAFCCVSLFSLVNPFISIWIGNDYLLNPFVVMIICLNLYMRLIRNTFLTFNDTYGHFVQLKWKCIAESVINLVVSLILVVPMNMGIFGVLLGTFISNITTNFWYEPYLLFTKKFGVGLKVYFYLFAKYFLVMAFSAAITFYVCNILISSISFLSFAFKVIYCCVIVNMIYVLMYRKTTEYMYFKHIIYNKISCVINLKKI